MLTEGFAGRTALVTGAGRGIGRACARRLAAGGAKVALAARTAAELHTVEEDIRAGGGAAMAVVMDVADAQAIAAGLERITGAWGPIDTAVTAAGIAESAPLAKTSDALWARTLQVNLTGTFALMRSLLPSMGAAGFGRFVAVASVAGKAGAPYIAAYTASKHGVLGLVRSAALEWAAKGVTVNAVCPGYVDTPMTDATIANIVAKTGRPAAEARATIEAMSPQGRLVTPDEVAHAVAFLASREAAAINGQGLNVDGGAVQS